MRLGSPPVGVKVPRGSLTTLPTLSCARCPMDRIPSVPCTLAEMAAAALLWGWEKRDEGWTCPDCNQRRAT